MSVLFILAHPAPSQSHFNAAWEKAASHRNYSTHILADHLLPDGSFDIEHEHDLLSLHQNIVLSFPIWWYSPAWLIQKWFADVLTVNFAYGAKSQLGGKTLTCLISTGQPESAYTHGGKIGFTIEELTASIRKTAAYCSMDYKDPFVCYGTVAATPASIEESTIRAMQHIDHFSNPQFFGS